MGILALWSFASRKRNRWLWVALGAYALFASSWMVARLYLQASEIRGSARISSCLVLHEIERYRPFTHFMFSPEPVYSFHARIPLPPSLAMLTLKRFWSGNMTNARLADEMEEIQPGIVLVPNDTRELPFESTLRGQYRLVYQDREHRLYVHRSLVRQAEY